MAIVSAPIKSSARLPELDGLRGWAALWVVLYHLGWEIFGIFPVYRNPIAAAFNGSLAVTVFFVLSGEALSSGFFGDRGASQVAGLALKRLPRLGLPIFFALLATFLLAKLGLTGHVQTAARIVHSEHWLGLMHPENITLVSLLRFPLIDAYTTAVPNFDRLPFLWTMNIEMLGSILVFTILLCWRFLRHAVWLVLTLGCLLLVNYPAANLSGFCFGIAISYGRHQGWLKRFAGDRWVKLFAPLAIVGLLALSAWAAMPHLFSVYPNMEARVTPLIAPALVVAISVCRLARAFLSSRLSQLLGTISFPIYLVQYPVIVSLTSYLIADWGRASPLTASLAAAIVALSTLACILAAVAFLPVEALTKAVESRAGAALLRREQVMA